MAITITDDYMDATKNDMGCKLGRVDDAFDASNAIVSPRAPDGSGSSEPAAEIPFHKHCQKTVCSAWQGGRGLTRTTLMPRNNDDTDFASGDLSNIQSFIFGTPDTWQGYFTRNSNNITEDLRSILELIDIISGQVAAKTNWNIAIKDCENKDIIDDNNRCVNINPWSGGSQVYTFTNIGRFLTLNIDGQELKFHTIKPGITGYDEDKLKLEFPKNDLTINFNGVQIAKIEDIYMPTDTEVDINQDFNKLSTGGYGANRPADGSFAPVTGKYHVYRYNHTLSQDYITPRFQISDAYPAITDNQETPIIEWEFHIRNTHPQTNTSITVNAPEVKYGNNASFFVQVVALTDQMYVEQGKTNVYVFRADLWQKSLTYSLAYVY